MIIMTSVSVQAKKVLLKYDLEPGTEFSFIVSHEQEIVQDLMGQFVVTESFTETRFLIKVLEKLEDGSYVLVQQEEALKLEIKNDFKNISYNSDEDVDPPAGLASVVRKLHVPVKFIMKSNGEVCEVIDAEDYLLIMKDAMESMEGPMQQVVAGIIGQSTSIDGIQSQLQVFFLKFPQEKIKLGFIWNQETESAQIVKFKNLIENILVEASKEKATINQTVKIEQLEMLEGMEMEGMTMTYELSGRKIAEYEVDVKTGLITKVDGVTDISGVISIESPQLESPMSIPMTLKMTETVVQIN